MGERPFRGDGGLTSSQAIALQRAVASHGAGQFAAAESAYREILRTDPDHPDALQLLGVLLAQFGRPAEGVPLMQRSLSLDGAQPGVYANLGNALMALNQFQAALECLERAIELMPELPTAWINHGGALIALGRFEDAVASSSRAMMLVPNHVLPVLNRARAHERLLRFEAALADYDQAIRMDAALASAHAGRAAALVQLGSIEEAAATLETMQRLDPQNEHVRGLRLHLQLCVADWSDWKAGSLALFEAIEAGRAAAPPLAMLALSNSAALQFKGAELYAQASGPAPSPLWTGGRYRHERLRLAYLSADLTDHPLAYLMAGVFEQHDKRRFETIALSWRRDEHSAMGRRVRSAFERVIDVEGRSEAETAALARAQEIDILVDLMGYTAGARAGVLARRAAPVQVNYLGFPGTLGRRVADYLIADDYVIPPANRSLYGEAIVTLPDCFQPNDDRRAASPQVPTRAQVGLPDEAFVWCSFHSTHKLNPPLFDVWMRLVQAVPGSVLWLQAAEAATERNIRREAALRGVDPQRIVGARKVPYAEHLARLRLADLCLDTWPFNGGATTSDALWAGVPIVTCAGQPFAARMSGSLLRCMGLPELITETFEDYERTALDLALNPQRRRELGDRMIRSKPLSPLFDTARYCRHLEAAYIGMYERYERGEEPASFGVPRD